MFGSAESNWRKAGAAVLAAISAICLLLLCFPAWGETALCPPEVGRAVRDSGAGKIAVQSGGVVTSLRTFAEIELNAITGRTRAGRKDPVCTVLSMAYQHESWAHEAMFPVESPRLAGLMGLDPAGHSKVSLAWLMRTPKARDFMSDEIEDTQLYAAMDISTRKALSRLRSRAEAFVNLPAELKIVPLGSWDDRWIAFHEFGEPELSGDDSVAGQIRGLDTNAEPYASALALHRSLEQLFKGQNARGLLSRVQEFRKAMEPFEANTPALAWNLDYYNTVLKPFQKSAAAYFVAFLGFVAYLIAARRAGNGEEAEPADAFTGAEGKQVPGSRAAWAAAFGLMCIATLLLAGALAVRYVLAGRMPLANMYESVTFSLGVFGVLALIFEAIWRRGWVGGAAALCGWLMMTVANSLPLEMRRVQPLVAVLNSPWLSFHVTTVMASYSAFLLSFVFCVLYFVKDLTGNRPGALPCKEVFETLCYRSVQIGWPLLTLGILLGAVWANTAWGSYWSWDPKETWALITWFTYTIYLHFRIMLGWRGRRSIAAAMLGFAMVLITYFGVSYLPGLAGGLHSYA